jgi:AMP deaminase
VRPEIDLTKKNILRETSPYKPWKIVPKPPPPHWHWSQNKEMITHPDGSQKSEEDEELDLDSAKLPGPDEDGFDFQIDDRGVYQVYKDTNG